MIGLFFVPYGAKPWGFFAHRHINRMAVFSLPPAMVGFYKKHIEYITDHAVDPDKRRCCDPEEAARHYIDLDHYNAEQVLPKRWDQAVVLHTEDSLQAYGILPWNLQRVFWRLTEAFKRQDVDAILRYSSDIGHYLADAHVPLHTTENYNGQLTGQKGIHAFWESRLPELFSGDYDYLVGRAIYFDDPAEMVWKAVRESFAAKDSVLLLEAELTKQFPTDRKYSMGQKGNKSAAVYSEEYSAAYSKKLNGMVERRMKASIITIASFWYSAWVNAGQPDLQRMELKEVSDSLKKANEAELEKWKNMKISNDREE